jgi:predicted acyl esterase
MFTGRPQLSDSWSSCSRTPYNKASSPDFGPAFAFRAASCGYVAIIQDVRGRSEGEWYPFRYEARDGYETVEWAAALPYSDGRVAMYGQSYNWVYQGGAFVQGFMESWTSLLAQDTLQRRVRRSVAAARYVRDLPVSGFPLFDIGSAEGLALA